jgi:hypothetical protein
LDRQLIVEDPVMVNKQAENHLYPKRKLMTSLQIETPVWIKKNNNQYTILFKAVPKKDSFVV